MGSARDQQQSELIKGFSHAGIPFAIVKGTALVHLNYGGVLGLRPSLDVDFLVSPRNRDAAIGWFLNQGFEYSEHFAKGDEGSIKSLGLSRTDVSLDINWRLHPFSLDSGLDDRALESRTLMPLGSARGPVLATPYNLIHTLLHGSGFNHLSGVRWVLDAHLITQTMTGIDWALFEHEVTQCGIVIPIRKQLQYLSMRFDSAIPVPLLDRLANAHPPVAGRLFNWHFTRPPQGFARRISRLAYAEYLGRPDLLRKGHPWRNFLLREPQCAWVVGRQYLRRRAPLKSCRMTRPVAN